MADGETKIPKTLYELLGTSVGATRIQIKNAYEQSVKRVQQRIEDGENAALDELALLRDAYHILSDAERRRHYDAWIRPQVDEAHADPTETGRGSTEQVSRVIVLLLIALALAGILTYLTLLESATEGPVEFASVTRPEKRN